MNNWYNLPENIFRKRTSKIIFCFFAAIFFSVNFLPSYFSQNEASAKKNPVTVPLDAARNRFIIQYKNGYSPDELEEKIKENNSKEKSILGIAGMLMKDLLETSPEENLSAIKKYDAKKKITKKEKLFKGKDRKLGHFYVIYIDNPSELENIMNGYNDQDFIESIQPDGIVYGTATTPNDTFYASQYYLPKIKANSAWDTQKGSKDIIIAIVDSGIDYNHPDLPADIIKGHNYVTDSADPMDDLGHGTFIAGVIGATTNNGIGVSGINWNATLMAIKVLTSDNWGYWTWVDTGIQEAVDSGAKIINLSVYGSGSCEPAQQAVLDYASSHNVLLVTAAGNNALDAINYQPPSCTGAFVIGATDSSDHRASFSNWGSVVALSAPGTGIYSTASSQCNPAYICPPGSIFNTYYQTGAGTSYATPQIVAGAALLLSQNNSLTSDQLKSYLVDNADTISTDHPIGPRLNILNSLSDLIADISLSPTITPTPIPSSTPVPSDTPTPSQTPTPSATYTPSPTPTSSHL